MSMGNWACLHCGFIETVKVVIVESAEYDVEADAEYSLVDIENDFELSKGMDPDSYIEQHVSNIYCTACGEELSEKNFIKLGRK